MVVVSWNIIFTKPIDNDNVINIAKTGIVLILFINTSKENNIYVEIANSDNVKTLYPANWNKTSIIPSK